MNENTAFKRYVDSVGGRRAAADKLGVSRALVDHMVTGIRAVSVQVAKRIAEQTAGKVALHELRPDIWDTPTRKPRKRVA